MHFGHDLGIKLILWRNLILWSCFKYHDNPTKTDDFNLLPDEQECQDTIRFNEEGHRCSILKKLISWTLWRKLEYRSWYWFAINQTFKIQNPTHPCIYHPADNIGLFLRKDLSSPQPLAWICPTCENMLNRSLVWPLAYLAHTNTFQ